MNERSGPPLPDNLREIFDACPKTHEAASHQSASTNSELDGPNRRGDDDTTSVTSPHRPHGHFPSGDDEFHPGDFSSSPDAIAAAIKRQLQEGRSVTFPTEFGDVVIRSENDDIEE
ncbi:MAG TPA: hypothetical protein VG935_03155 [Patescibacteria group bacterium]|nr:hypothetical protein [Patescibacteria group bacterium]